VRPLPFHTSLDSTLCRALNFEKHDPDISLRDFFLSRIACLAGPDQRLCGGNLPHLYMVGSEILAQKIPIQPCCRR
jgi:hypothetical protein